MRTSWHESSRVESSRVESSRVESSLSPHTSAMSSKLSEVDPTTAGRCPKAATPSSKRIRAARNASSVQEESRHSKRRGAEKRKKIAKECIVVHLPEYEDRAVDVDVLKDSYHVYDGGEAGNPPIQHRGDLPKPFVVQHVRSLHVIDGHLRNGKGLGLYAADDKTNTFHFCIAPRKYCAQNLLNKGKVKSLVTAFDRVTESKKIPNQRAKSIGRQVFCDESSCKPVSVPYTVAGVQAPQGAKGVKSHSRQAPELAKTNNKWAWDALLDLIKRLEFIYKQSVPKEVIAHLEAAKKVVDFPTYPSHDGSKKSEYLGAVAYAKNVYLSMHDDDDFSYSIMSPQMEHLSEKVVMYFAFPSLGICVPLRPGDVLIFNPRTFHGASSRCRNADEIYCTSVYQKTKVVGGNDNSMPVTEEQELLGGACK